MAHSFATWLSWGVAALVAAAVLWRWLRRSDEPGRLAWRWVGTVVAIGAGWLYASRVIGFDSRGGYVANFGAAILLAGGIAGVGVVLAALWRNKVGELLARPLVSLFDGGTEELKPAPLYSTAEARRKQGRPEEAIEEIQRQLERFPGDFQGTLLMAQVQAEDLHDLPAAEATLRGWISGTRRDHGHQAVALMRLADWHLHLARDAGSARQVFEEICQQFPDSEAAFLADQRLAHLANEARPRRGPIALPEGWGRPVDIGVPPPAPAPSEGLETADLVRHLAQYPNDVAAHERLALLYAWHYQRADLARSELEHLVATKHAPPTEVARWFNLMADVEIQVVGDLQAARRALQRLIDRNPKAAAADVARNRIHLLPRELARHATPQRLRLNTSP